MMSQQRTRKPAGAEQMSRGRVSAKASGDQCLPSKNYEKKYQSGVNTGDKEAGNVQNKQRSRSKSKIPKSLRNDLENALVGLCDVWFEEIKPHLVRNKIKLHVHDAIGRNASGDYTLQQSEATCCSHFDPGAAFDPRRRRFANCARCCSTQPTASRVPSHRQPVSLPSRPHYASPANRPSPNRSPRRNRRREDTQQKHTNHESEPPQPNSREWRVPRLCHTYSFPPAVPRIMSRPPAAETISCQHAKQDSPQNQERRHQHSAATVVLPKQRKSRPVQQQHRLQNQGVSFRGLQNAVLSAPPAALSLQNDVRRKTIKPQNSQVSTPYRMHEQNHQPDFERRISPAGLFSRYPTYILPKPESKKQTRTPTKLLQDLRVHEAVLRKESLTTLRPAPVKANTRESRQQCKRSQRLFQDDLVDIIAKKSDKQLKLLYRSPPREESPSVMNLLRLDHGRLIHTTNPVKKIRPWR